MSNVFRLLRKPMLVQYEKATRVVLTCAYLHNFLKRNAKSRNMDMPKDRLENILREPNYNWRLPFPLERQTQPTAKDSWEEFANYFYIQRNNL